MIIPKLIYFLRLHAIIPFDLLLTGCLSQFPVYTLQYLLWVSPPSKTLHLTGELLVQREYAQHKRHDEGAHRQ